MQIIEVLTFWNDFFEFMSNVKSTFSRQRKIYNFYYFFILF